MTKRFTFEIKTRGNKAYTQWYDDGKPINSAETVVDLLNSLNKENGQLKKQLQQYKDKHKKWIEECEELHKDFEKDWKRWGRM